jgi:hypothetical protein
MRSIFIYNHRKKKYIYVYIRWNVHIIHIILLFNSEHAVRISDVS